MSDQGEASYGADVKCALRIQRRRQMKVSMLREYFLEEITLELDFKSEHLNISQMRRWNFKSGEQPIQKIGMTQ